MMNFLFYLFYIFKLKFFRYWKLSSCILHFENVLTALNIFFFHICCNYIKKWGNSNPFPQTLSGSLNNIFQLEMFCQKALFRNINDNEQIFIYILW